ncbi:hypothetical protein HHX47_DHR4000928 [Lentinula edodes]|nr:hypothetical protein HHX47_DHR4000928 [Lentinula edodes]
MKPDLTRPTTDSNSNSESNLNDDAATVVHEPLTPDIEHMPVVDDPRQWSNFRKNFILLQVAFGSMIAGLAGNIQNPAINEMEVDLPATASQISLSLSLFILLQGVVPLIWASISEVKGRRFVYIVSMAIFTVGSVVVATSKSIGLLIGFRCFQAAGSSAVMSIGAATLADIYDPVERGTKMGIYYIAPLLGPSLGSILGGGLTTAFTWRGPFYFLAIMGGVVFMSFLLFFRDTFRHERSHTYQSVLKARLKGAGTKKNVGVENIDADNAAQDIEKQEVSSKPVVAPEVKLGLVDVNPFRPMAFILRRKYNLFMLTASGTVGGSIVGGRWSDYQLSKLKIKNEGKSTPEDGLGDGWMYTIIAFIMAISGALIVIVMLNGSRWRREAEESEAAEPPKMVPLD